MNILEEIAAYAKKRVEFAKSKISLSKITNQALALEKGEFNFYKALKKEGLSFILECKKASPSKGLIANSFPYLEIAQEYEQAGADCISVLTEPKWFLGSDNYLKEIANQVNLPCLRKDFLIDEYMIYEAKLLNASAILLICSLLDEKQLKDYLDISESLGLSALVEAHNEREIEKALKVEAKIIGVNNRNLKNFSVDILNSQNLRKLIPQEIIFVSESGIKTREEVKNLENIGVNAVLIGEAMMLAEDKKAKFRELSGK